MVTISRCCTGAFECLHVCESNVYTKHRVMSGCACTIHCACCCFIVQRYSEWLLVVYYVACDNGDNKHIIVIVIVVVAAAAADVGADGEADEEPLQLHVYSLPDDA